MRDLIHLKLKEAEKQRLEFEERYGMDFKAFKQAWDAGRIADKYTYKAERDYWEWEAAVTTDEEWLREMLEELL